MPLIPMNLSNIDPAADFVLPVGPYVLQVTAVTIEPRHDGNGQRMSVENQVVLGPGMSQECAGRKIYNNYMLSEKGAPFIVRLYNACGFDKATLQQAGANLQTEWLIGRQYVCLNNHRKTDDGKTYNNITGEKHVSEWDAMMQAYAGQAAPAGPSQSSLLGQPAGAMAPPAATPAAPMAPGMGVPNMPPAAATPGVPAPGGFAQPGGFPGAPAQPQPGFQQPGLPQPGFPGAPAQPGFAPPNPAGAVAPPAPGFAPPAAPNGAPGAPVAPAFPTPPAPPPPGGFQR